MILLRIFLLLLIFTNLVIFLWGRESSSQPGEPERLAQQIAPEKIVLLPSAPAAEPPAAPALPAPAAKTAEPRVCVAVSGFGRAQARVVAAKFKTDANGIEVATRTLGDADSYWVMYPELPSRAQAERKAAEIRGLGVTDLFIMGDDTPHPNAISLGLFKSREKAEEYFESLKKKGVRAARIVVREAANSRNVLEFSGPREAVEARITQLLAAWRGVVREKCQASE